MRRRREPKYHGGAVRADDDEAMVAVDGEGADAADAAESAAPDPAQTRHELIALSIIRLAMSGYRTGQVACWESAFSATSEILGPVDGPAVFGRVIALVHAVRSERVGTFVFLPVACSELSPDERDLVRLLRAARGRTPVGLDGTAARFGGRETAPLIRLAARALGVLLDRLEWAGSIGPDDLDAVEAGPPPTRH
ncbi:hypothetical protein [Prosthecomicrobium hirschii]|uniref:hypothetical protein n=1 Tax=Prosthecodimorpha hirschii TaxID=665126 RepID=UPI00221ECD91|nr:hypothetical protein [Prosthecomicrobium hirschii]MCW1839850.1 hypothetical protein [Prosthecomicrobium hirschii]